MRYIVAICLLISTSTFASDCQKTEKVFVPAPWVDFKFGKVIVEFKSDWFGVAWFTDEDNGDEWDTEIKLWAPGFFRHYRSKETVALLQLDWIADPTVNRDLDRSRQNDKKNELVLYYGD